MEGVETFIHQDAGGYSLVCRETNVVGKPYEGKPHVRFDVAGGGNQGLGLRRHSLTLPAVGVFPVTAPAEAGPAPGKPAAEAKIVRQLSKAM